MRGDRERGATHRAGRYQTQPGSQRPISLRISALHEKYSQRRAQGEPERRHPVELPGPALLPSAKRNTDRHRGRGRQVRQEKHQQKR